MLNVLRELGQRRGVELGIFCRRNLEIAKETELGKECQVSHGPRKDAEAKAYIGKLQILL